MMTLVTTPGLETMDRCGACGTKVMRAFAACAMAISSAGGMARSAVPTTAQEGMVFQAGTPDFWFSAIVDSGSWVARENSSRAARFNARAVCANSEYKANGQAGRQPRRYVKKAGDLLVDQVGPVAILITRPTAAIC
jgi:hypothetical protein